MSGSVLIIDGDQAFAETTQNALEAAGIQVWVRQDGTFDTVRELRPHVLLLNVELPRGSGFAICSRIRRDKALKATPIFLTSSEATAEAFQAHAESADSANEYAMKPIAIDDVVNRVGKLIANRPPPLDIPQNGDAVAPPPIPPPLKKTATDDTPPPLAPAISASPENTPIPTAGLGSDDLWPSVRYEDAMRATFTGADDTMPKGRVSPEERLQALRALVKQHEVSKRVFQETWQRANERGQELARRIVGLTSELETRDDKIVEVKHSLADTTARLEAVEGEFRTFQDEITRIFKEKDAEEGSRASYLSELEATKEAQTLQLQEAFERQTDDERRLTIIQEDLDLLQNEKDAATTKLEEVEDAFAKARDHIANLEQRLDMTNDVASQRADEIQALGDKLDELAFDRNSERQRMENEHEAKVEALLSEHVDSMERERNVHEAALEAFAQKNDAAHATELEEVNKLHADLVDVLNSTNEGELEEATARIATLTKERNRLNEDVQSIRADLDETTAARASEVGQLTAELTALRSHSEQIEADLEDETESRTKLAQAKAALEKKLAEASAALHTARGQIQSLDADLDQERTTSLERAGQLSSIESELDTAQAQLFERMSELDHTKKQLHAIESRATDLETSLRTTEKALKTSDAEGRAFKTKSAESEAERIALEQQVELLEEQHSRLEEKVRDTEVMLEDERARVSQGEDILRRAREQIAAFNADDTADRLQAELNEERATRDELESSLQTVQAERQQLEADVAELTRDRAELDASVDQLEQEKSDLQTALAVSEERYEETETSRREIARAADAADQRLTNTAGAKKKLETALAEERSARVDLQDSLESERRTRTELQLLFESESETRAELEARVETLESSLTHKEAELGEIYAEQTDVKRRAASKVEGREAELAELRATVSEKDRELQNLEVVLASANEELEIHRAQSQGLSQTAHRAEQAQSDTVAQLEKARRTVQTLEKSEKALLTSVSDHEDVINEWRFATESMKSTLSALQRDIEAANTMTDDTAIGQSFDKLLGRIARAVAMCMETLDDSEESRDLPVLEREFERSADIDLNLEIDDDIPIYTGEVESLDPLSDLEQEGLQIIQRKPVAPGRTPQRRAAPSKISPPPGPEEPFAALMAEIGTDDGPKRDDPTTASGGAFGAGFEGERTSTDNRALTSKSAAFIAVDDDEDEDERNVTEIINIHELE